MTMYRCGNCIGCFKVSDCDNCSNCINKETPCLRRICLLSGALAAEAKPATNDAPQPARRDSISKKEPNVVKKEQKKAKKKESIGTGVSKKVKNEEPKKYIDAEGKVRLRKPHKPHKPHVWRPKELRNLKKKHEDVLQQCYGPGCVKAARSNSKYCANECGLRLADVRLKTLMAVRAADFYMSKPMAERAADAKVNVFNRRKIAAEAELADLNQMASTLSVYIESLSELNPSDRKDEKSEVECAAEEAMISCISCGEDFNVPDLLTHIQECCFKCGQKLSYASNEQMEENPNDIICDVLDKKMGTYCKHLRISCPLHYNDSVGSQMKMCGYPLRWDPSKSFQLKEMLWNLDEMLSGGICTKKREACEEHFLWEQNTMAMIDHKRFRIALTLDGISEAYTNLSDVYSYRGDAVTLLMNWRTSPYGNARERTFVPLEMVKEYGGLASFLKSEPDNQLLLGPTNYRAPAEVIMSIKGEEMLTFEQTDFSPENVFQSLNKALRQENPGAVTELQHDPNFLHTTPNVDLLTHIMAATQTDLAANYDPLEFYLIQPDQRALRLPDKILPKIPSYVETLVKCVKAARNTVSQAEDSAQPTTSANSIAFNGSANQ